MPGQTRTSAAAVTSLVCGLLLCIPGVTALVAIICGIIGISVTGNPMVKGRGMAIAGLILGLLNIVGWTGIVGGYWSLTKPERTLSRQFVSDISSGNNNAAAAECTTNITADQIQSAVDWFNKQGTLKDTMMLGSYFATANGNTTGNTSGMLTFGSGQTHTFSFTLVQQQGVWKIDTFRFQ